MNHTNTSGGHRRPEICIDDDVLNAKNLATRDFLLLCNIHASGNVRAGSGKHGQLVWEYLGHHCPNGVRTEAWLPVNAAASAGYSRLARARKIVVDHDRLVHVAAGALDGDPGERWALVHNFLGLYDVSDMGRIRSFHSEDPAGRLVKPDIGQDGYHTVRLRRPGERCALQIRVHHLVLEAFRGTDTPSHKARRPRVRHINGDRRDDRLANLRWMTDRDRSPTPAPAPTPPMPGETCPMAHPLTDDNVYFERGRPKCRTCRRARQRERRRLAKAGLL